MTRRLTVAIVAVVAATLLVTAAGSVLLIRRAAISTAEQQLGTQARSIAATAARGDLGSHLTLRRQLAVIRQAGDFAALRLVVVGQDGTVTGTLPAGLAPARLDVRSLLAGRAVTGHTGHSLLVTTAVTVFAAVPVTVGGTAAGLPVLVVTRRVPGPADGIRYFLVVGAAALAVAALVAVRLARRTTRPLTDAVDATRRIAGGDLAARVPRTRREIPEIAALAEAIDTMAAHLERARAQERQFLLSVSHELRTPLTSIRGYAGAVLDGTATDVTGALRVIDAEAVRLERLVRDLLDLARLDAGRFAVELVPVDALAVARQVADAFRPGATEAGLVLEGPAPGEPVWVQADADRLAQVVANLLENAAAHARAHLAVSVAGGATPSLSVTDDGDGIGAEDLPHVFERHFTADRGSRRRAGSGLGLAIVAELLDAMGGSVRARSPSTAAGGTTMTVTLPSVPAPPTAPVGTRPASAGPASGSGGER